MKLVSKVKELGSVTFPEFTGERIYMRKFTKQEGLPFDLARWQPTVDAMLKHVDCSGDIFIMVDQGQVHQGTSHRRGGLHVDGYWFENLSCHGGGGHGGSRIGQGWGLCDFSEHEALILASDVSSSRALVGNWQGKIKDGGDCSEIDTTGLRSIPLLSGLAYAGNVSMLHESLPVAETLNRTLVRLSVKGWDFPA